MNATEAGEAGAAENMGEDGFGLIVGGVRDGDFVELVFGGEAFEERVAGAAGGVFEIGTLAFGFGGDVFAGNEEGERVAFSEVCDETFVRVRGTAAKLVIEMDGGEDDAELFTELEEQREKSDGIGATGNGYTDALTRGGPMIFAELVEWRSLRGLSALEGLRSVIFLRMSRCAYRSNVEEAGRASCQSA
jgi:hypothetical protein